MLEQSVIVAHENALSRVGIKTIIENSCGKVSVSTVGSFEALVDAIHQRTDSLLIVDVDLPGMSGMTGLGTVLREHHPPKTCLAVPAVSRDLVSRCIAIGALACIDHDHIADEVCDVIAALADGRPYFSRLCGDPAVTPCKTTAALTQQQLNVLHVLAQGKSNKQIGRELGICEGTVKVHLNAAYRALGVVNRVSAVTKLRDLSRTKDAGASAPAVRYHH